MVPAPYAMDESQSRGRRYPEPKHPYRSDYARDRDRVIHSRAFRRLEAKTQAFTLRFSDHFRNRLTHTLEVAQIARTVARVLGLNEELTEALALVHDIGHPPFGHAGERVLDQQMRRYGGRFDHNLHALRMVEQFEQRYLDFSGLNLTFEVREGIIKHSRDYSAGEAPELAEFLLDLRPPLEAQLIDPVDEIAYNCADLDDGYEARILDLAAVRGDLPLFAEGYREVEKRHSGGPPKLKFNAALKQLLDRMVTDLIEATATNIGGAAISSVEEVRRHPRRLAGLSPGMAEESRRVKGFLFAHLYDSPQMNEEREKSVAALNELFQFFMDQPDRMPQQHALLAREEPRHRVVCDYIAGMTDHYLLRQHRELLPGSRHALALTPPGSRFLPPFS
jgi:dGTPase